MTKEFLNGMETILEENKTLSRTENGALGYAGTGRALLDLNFLVSSLRGASPEEIGRLFLAAWQEDEGLALRFLCYARDVRGGLGERRLFRVMLAFLTKTAPETAARLVPLIPEYGRYDDLFVLFGTPAEKAMISFVVKTLRADLKAARAREAARARGESPLDFPLTLLGKWMPSVNASSQKSRQLALRWMKILGMNARKYRQSLSLLRQEIRVVERDMCANRWTDIDYSAVPSRAAMLYHAAFYRHDGVRYQEYLDAVNAGAAKIHSAALFPYEIVARYHHELGWAWWTQVQKPVPSLPVLEALWNALPGPKNMAKNLLVVRDGSGSMTTMIPKSQAMLLDVSTAMAIYASQYIEGPFRDHFITFSSNPRLIDLSGCQTLAEKLARTYQEDDWTNTDIEAVFSLILETAQSKGLSQADMPGTVLIISDMEFDGGQFGWNTVLFETIQQRYKAAGYRLPRLVFWNVGSRTKTVPLLRNDLGLILLSGFSSQLYAMAASDDLDPYKALVRILMGKRYDPAGAALTAQTDL